MAIEVKRLDQTAFTVADVVELIHRAFKERKDEGLFFSCADISVEEYIEKVGNGVIFVAVDTVSGHLLGTGVTHFRKDKKGHQYGFNELLAIDPEARRMGIASAMLKARADYNLEKGSEYLASDTAVGADSSVKYHFKNGFRIVGMVSFPQTNYYSYVFRRQLKTDTFGQRLYTKGWYCKLLYLRSAIRTRLIRRPDGEFTGMVKLFLRLTGKRG
ncbi:MAG: GNAT family N-acetyltransferase [Bacteroidales bacterium]|nr:GNAT family N-acetyltransferase [Bacteroidales bacterium]